MLGTYFPCRANMHKNEHVLCHIVSFCKNVKNSICNDTTWHVLVRHTCTYLYVFIYTYLHVLRPRTYQIQGDAWPGWNTDKRDINWLPPLLTISKAGAVRITHLEMPTTKALVHCIRAQFFHRKRKLHGKWWSWSNPNKREGVLRVIRIFFTPTHVLYWLRMDANILPPILSFIFPANTAVGLTQWCF